MKKIDLTVLVLSCDQYKDLWKPFFYCFNKYWPDCPYPVVLGTNTKINAQGKIPTILSGPDKDWSSSLRKILKSIQTPYVFLWLDDIFAVKHVDTKRFEAAFTFVKAQKAKHLHIQAVPKPDQVTQDGTFGIYHKGAPYRVNSLGFWDVSYLSQLLLPGENPWNFEILGSYRTAYDDGFYCSMENLVERIHVVEKGKIFRDAFDYCKCNNIPLDTSARSVLERGSYWKSQLQKWYFNTVFQLPWRHRLRVMNILRKLIISY